jgi:hypothetical protein
MANLIIINECGTFLYVNMAWRLMMMPVEATEHLPTVVTTNERSPAVRKIQHRIAGFVSPASDIAQAHGQEGCDLFSRYLDRCGDDRVVEPSHLGNRGNLAVGVGLA